MVNEGDRGKLKLEVATKANELAIYTIQICKNPKIFKPEYQHALTDDIIRTSKDIFIDVWAANNIRVNKDPEKWKERKQLQERALRNCINLLAQMQMAQRLFHLKLKRVKYWGQRTVEVKELIKGWKESDEKRYGNL